MKIDAHLKWIYTEKKKQTSRQLRSVRSLKDKLAVSLNFDQFQYLMQAVFD